MFFSKNQNLPPKILEISLKKFIFDKKTLQIERLGANYMEKVLPIFHCGSREETVCFDGLVMFYQNFTSSFVISTPTVFIFSETQFYFLKIHKWSHQNPLDT